MAECHLLGPRVLGLAEIGNGQVEAWLVSSSKGEEGRLAPGPPGPNFSQVCTSDLDLRKGGRIEVGLASL